MATSKEQLQQRLSEAEEAYHSLMTGLKEVVVTYNNRTVTFNQTSKNDLKIYIDELKIQLGIKKGRRAIRPRF
jgi:hypothetical protein